MGSWIKAGLVGFVSLSVLASCSAPSGQQSASSATKASASKVSALKEPEIAAPPNRLRLLSQDQYFNTIANIFGPDVLPNVTFAPFQRTDGLLALGAGDEGITEDRVELYQRAASAVAANVVSPERRDFLVPCKPVDEHAADKVCATKFLSAVGRRLNRRPLTPVQLNEIVEFAGKGAERLNDFYAGLSVALEGLLAHPRTLYIEETTEPDPAHPGQRRLDSYSLASRLSFFLWNQAPDDALLDAAAKGTLFDAKGRAKAVDAMLASTELETGVRAFFNDMLAFDSFATLAKDATIYPVFTGAAVEASREQTLQLVVDHLVTHKGDYRDLFTSRVTFISSALAPVYGLPAQTMWTRYELPGSARVGLLTQISFLALHSHPGRSSPTLRGKALRELLMCQTVPPPPPNVDFSAVENPDPNIKTARDRLTIHRTNPVCAGCHKITDPMGLALENFDGAGQYRDKERGAVIDASGELDGKPFKDAAGLGQVLHDHPAVPSCLVKRVYSYGVGGKLRRDDDPMVAYLSQRFAESGYRLPDLMRTVALSDAFVEIGNATPANATSGNK